MTGGGFVIGRDAELGMVRERLLMARSGRGSIVLVAGEPGIGKSTFAAAAIDTARSLGMVAALGRCREDGGAPAFRPFVQVLRSIRRSRHAAADPALETLLEGRPPDAAADRTEADRFRLFESMAEALAGPEDTSTLIVVDDLHRADDGSIAFLRYLAAEIASMPVVVLGAYRDTEVDAGHPLGSALGMIADTSAMQMLTLHGLGPGDTRRLIEVRAGKVTAAVAEQVHDRTAGNPLFTVEIAALLRLSSGTPAEVASSAIPGTVREVIAHRVERLSPETRHALRVAAVLGREFGELPLAATIGTSQVAVAAALQPAATARLITAIGGSGYTFAHALVQAAVYEAIPPVERAALHCGAVAAIRSLGRQDDEAISALAFHSHRAAAFPETGRQVVEALADTLAAGRRAAGRLAFGEAARWLGLAVELAERLVAGPAGDDASLVDLLFETAGAETLAGRSQDARRHYESAGELARRRGDIAALGRAAIGIGSTVVTAGRVDWELVAVLEEVIDAGAGGAMLARLRSRLAVELYWHEGGDAARAESAAAMAIATSCADEGALGVALHARQFTLRSPDHLEDRIAIGEQLVHLATGGKSDETTVGNSELSFVGAVWLAADVMRTGDLPRFRALVQSLEAQATRARRPLWRWYATVMAAQLATIEARHAEAVELAGAAGALGRQLDVDVAAAYRLSQLCALARDGTGLTALAGEIDAVSTQLPYFVTIRSLKALAAACGGRFQDVVWELDRLSGDCFAAVPRDSLWVATIALLTEASSIAATQHTAALVELLAPYSGTFVVQGLPSCWGTVDRFLGRGRLALGDVDGAAADLRRALELEEGIGALLFSARTSLDLARLELRLGDDAAASRRAAAVGRTAERLGLAALAAEATTIASGAGITRPATQVPLSRREREVLACLATGASNKELGVELGISLNTVERHLANIYGKLALRGRADAAAYAVRTGLAGPVENGGSP